jgi:hypothetical protein
MNLAEIRSYKKKQNPNHFARSIRPLPANTRLEPERRFLERRLNELPD